MATELISKSNLSELINYLIEPKKHKRFNYNSVGLVAPDSDLRLNAISNFLTKDFHIINIEYTAKEDHREIVSDAIKTFGNSKFKIDFSHKDNTAFVERLPSFPGGFNFKYSKEQDIDHKLLDMLNINYIKTAELVKPISFQILNSRTNTKNQAQGYLWLLEQKFDTVKYKSDKMMLRPYELSIESKQEKTHITLDVFRLRGVKENQISELNKFIERTLDTKFKDINWYSSSHLKLDK